MKKKVGIIKQLLCIGLVFLLQINSFASIVSDNDGSAFITKAEFDALKDSLENRIDSYNQSIDSKIDGAIANYLSGIQLALEKPINIDTMLSWPVRVIDDGYSTFTNHARYKYSAAIHMMRQPNFWYVYDEVERNGVLRNVLILDEGSKYVIGNYTDLSFAVKLGLVGYTFNSTLTASFRFAFFLNGTKYAGRQAPWGAGNSYDVYDVDNFRKDKFYKTTDKMGIIPNYMFEYGGNQTAASDLTWSTLKFSANTNGSVYKSEAGSAPLNFFDVPIVMSGLEKSINTLANNDNAGMPFIYKSSSGNYWANLIQMPDQGYPHLINLAGKFYYINGSGKHNVSIDSRVYGIVYPFFAFYSNIYSSAAGRDWTDCSIAKAELLKYVTKDTISGTDITMSVADGIYLASAENDGSVRVDLEFENTGAFDKTIMFHKTMIMNDGSTALPTNVYDFSLLGSSASARSYTFNGNINQISFMIKNVKKGERIFMKTLCDHDFDYTSAPVLTLISYYY